MPRFVEAAFDDRRRRGDLDAERFEDVGAAGAARDERLPCLATRTPQAATTSAAHDEMLNVPARSPPVPQVSNTSS